MVQKSVGTIVPNVKSKFQNYVTGLIASSKRKNCTQIAATLSLSHDAMNRTLNSEEAILPFIPAVLFNIVNVLSLQETGWLVIDDSLISKLFAKLIEGLDYNYNSSMGKSEMSLCAVVIAWTNGKITIPLNFKFWLSQSIAGDHYKTKIAIAKTLIAEIMGKLEFEGVVMDGLYCSTDMINFLNNEKIKFDMRMPANRVIENEKGEKAKLKNSCDLKLRRNEHSRTVRAWWRGIPLYFTAELRIDKNGEKSVVFIVSNWYAPSKCHVEVYKKRWVIEVFFRTAKQSLGIQQCSARRLKRQRVHIYGVFYAYSFLQVKKEQKRKLNVESLIKDLQENKPKYILKQLAAFSQFFEAIA